MERALARGIRDLRDCRGGSLELCTTSKDKIFILDVITSTTKILQVAIELASLNMLRYCPSRTLVFATSASVLLLKALFLSKAIGHGLGYFEFEVQLGVIDGFIRALRMSPIDEMDFSPRYAMLIESRVTRLRSSLTSADGANTGTESFTNSMRGTYPSLVHDSSSSRISGPAPGTVRHNDGDQSRYGHNDIEWWSAPFDPTIAPFDSDNPFLSLGLELDSLDFLWNISDPSGEDMRSTPI